MLSSHPRSTRYGWKFLRLTRSGHRHCMSRMHISVVTMLFNFARKTAQSTELSISSVYANIVCFHCRLIDQIPSVSIYHYYWYVVPVCNGFAAGPGSGDVHWNEAGRHTKCSPANVVLFLIINFPSLIRLSWIFRPLYGSLVHRRGYPNFRC